MISEELNFADGKKEDKENNSVNEFNELYENMIVPNDKDDDLPFGFLK